MRPVFQKLNFKPNLHAGIVVTGTPESFAPLLDELRESGVIVSQRVSRSTTILLAFVTALAEVGRVAKSVTLTEGDAIVWLAYPKQTSKRHTCEFHRDNGFDALGRVGFEAVRGIAIDDDWSALRFRRVEYVRTMTRQVKNAISPEGQARAKKAQG
jgi:hypothetical protein